ncbi:IS256 family transposase [[Actinomadura] parvosata]|uniref:IS256 family transposase n=1 Tax=[Actinomadura] parvosata TaxID=1955412 RepID=UPI00406D27BD
MPRTLPPVQAIRAEIDALFTEGRDLVEVIEDVARLGARLIIQTAVEAEVDAFLGRARYQRAATATATAGDAEAPVRPGYRNGHCPTTVKTTSGPITIARPKLRGTTEKFASRLFGAGVTRTHALETLVIASFVRGLSVRDVEGALADALGPEAALSKSTVSTICQAIVAEYDIWCRRDLTAVELDYLFLDASHFKMHDGSRAEPILAAWGITTAGKPVFVGLAAAGSESTDAWHDFLTDLAGRGLRPPLLIVSDGAPGLISAAEQVFASSLRQRCLVHRRRQEITCRFPISDLSVAYGNLPYVREQLERRPEDSHLP